MAPAAANNVCLCGRYTLLGKLGAGGHGEVWRARDHERGIEIALKVLSPELARNAGAWEALQREYDIASRLDHPLILKIFQPERDGGVVVLPMELAPGGDLRRLRSVSYLEIGPVLLEVAQALDYTHEHGIVHRDLKPGNVLFDSRGHVRLADFGVAGTVLGSTATAGKPARAELSPFTASPEQLRGEPPAVTDDIYGLGALAYELLSGYPPYYPRFELRRIVEEPVPQLKAAHQAPDRLIALVMAMLSKRAELRPRSMREIIDSIESMLNDTLAFDEAAETSPAARELPELPEPAEHIEPPSSGVAGAEAIPPPPESFESREPVRSTLDVATVDVPCSRAAAELERASPRERARPRQQPIEPPPIAPMRAARSEPASDPDLRALWADLKMERVPGTELREFKRRGRWASGLIVALAAAAAVSFFWLPHWAATRSWLPSSLAFLERLAPRDTAGAVSPAASTPPQTPASATSGSTGDAALAAGASSAPAAVTEDGVHTARSHFDARLAALDARNAGVWGGQAYADARAREAEAIGADEAGSTSLAAQKLAEGERLLGEVEQSAPSALAAELASGERELKAGNGAAARQAFELASRIDPSNSQAADGLKRTQALDGTLPLLVDGMNAESAHDYARAAQDYRRLLSSDPGNAKAQAGLRRATAALGTDQYSKAVGIGLDALRDGRLQAARQAFELAHRIDHRGREAEEGLERVSDAMQARELSRLQSRGMVLEAQQRWGEALQVYEQALDIDPSLSFAQQGKTRVAARMSTEPVQLASAGPGVDLAGARPAPAGLTVPDLASRMQALVDDPRSLDSPAVRAEAAALIRESEAMQPASGLQRQMASRLAALLLEYDKTVRLSLTSDNVTEVEIPQIGSFGTFSRREIDLKPGTYTVIGTRAGYRDVRRDVTIEPGQESQTISVSCQEPI